MAREVSDMLLRRLDCRPLVNYSWVNRIAAEGVPQRAIPPMARRDCAKDGASKPCRVDGAKCRFLDLSRHAGTCSGWPNSGSGLCAGCVGWQGYDQVL